MPLLFGANNYNSDFVFFRTSNQEYTVFREVFFQERKILKNPLSLLVGGSVLSSSKFECSQVVQFVKLPQLYQNRFRKSKMTKITKMTKMTKNTKNTKNTKKYKKYKK